MNSTAGKITIGLLTVLPLVFLVLFVVAITGGLFKPDAELLASDDPVVFILPLGGMLLTLLLATVTGLAMFVYYIIHILNNQRLDATQRLGWSFVVLLGGAFGCLIYWLFQIWREEDDRINHEYRS